MCRDAINTLKRSPLAPRGLSASWLSALLALALGEATLAQTLAAEPVRGHFRSAGKTIEVEWFGVSRPGKVPALVVLHGVDGIDGACAAIYRTTARTYAQQGYGVLLVHYFDRTGKTPADLARYRQLFHGHFRQQGKAEERTRMRELFDAWTETVADAVTHARGRPDVDGKRVALVGLSLGGALALHATAEKDLKLAALVELFGALPTEARGKVKKLPPTLIIHGDADEVVPVDQAYVLVGLLVAQKLQPEVEVYREAGHMFFKGENLQILSFRAAKVRTDEFLDKHLQPARGNKPE